MDIHQRFVKLGRERNRITYELCALLPQIYKEGTYKEKGCKTIVEYAGKFAGLPKSVVKKALRLEEKLEGKPHLQKTVASQGVHKVDIVAQIATPETDAEWADKVENMSKSALQELSREIRGKETAEECCAVPTKMMIELDEEAQFLFLKLKKQMGENSSNKEALKTMLKKLGQQINRTVTPRSKKKVTEIPGDFRDKNSQKLQNKQSRYIEKQKEREAIAKTHGKCGYPGCNKPHEVIHHTDPFSTSKNHSSIIPLCKEHHEFAHNGLIQNQKHDPAKWRLKIDQSELTRTDQLYRNHRQVALL